MDGVDLIKSIIKIRDDIKMLLCTGNSLEEFMKYGQSEILTYFKNLNREDEKEKNIIGK